MGDAEKEEGMQGSRLYVGNLKYSTTSSELEKLFSDYGVVKDATVLEGKGFGFVEMSDPSEAEKAMEALNGFDLLGRAIRIDEARPRQSGGRGDSGERRGFGRF